MRIEFVPVDTQAGANAALAVLAHEGAALSPEARAANEATGGALARAIAGGRFTGAKGQTLDLVAPHGLEAARLVLVGVDGSGAVEPEVVETAAAAAYQAVKATGVSELVLKLGADAESAARAAFGARLAAYRFDKYRTTEKAEKKPSVTVVKVAAADPVKAQKAYEPLAALADALWYCQERFKPQFMIDLATLTGAIIISLGHDYAGLFSNNDGLSEKLLAAGKAERETLWRLPMPAAYEKQIESPIADMKNIGGRPAGSITAALFLQKFVNGVPWAHLDIASVAWRKPSTDPTVPDGAAGYGVRLLNRLVADAYEG